jgi:hypothetical protein
MEIEHLKEQYRQQKTETKAAESNFRQLSLKIDIKNEKAAVEKAQKKLLSFNDHEQFVRESTDKILFAKAKLSHHPPVLRSRSDFMISNNYPPHSSTENMKTNHTRRKSDSDFQASSRLMKYESSKVDKENYFASTDDSEIFTKNVVDFEMNFDKDIVTSNNFMTGENFHPSLENAEINKYGIFNLVWLSKILTNYFNKENFYYLIGNQIRCLP